AARGAERNRRLLLAHLRVRQSEKEQPDGSSHCGVENEHSPQRDPRLLRQTRSKRAERAGHRADERVARKRRRSIGGRGEHGVIERHENARVAAARVEGADAGDEEERPERGKPRETEPGRRHQQGRREQQAADREAMTPAPDGERGERRAEQRRRADDPDLEQAQPQRQEVRRQDYGDEAVGEPAQRPTDEDPPDNPSLHQRYSASYMTMP